MVLNHPVWWVSISIRWDGGPGEFSTHFAALRLAENGGKPLFALGEPTSATLRDDFLSSEGDLSTNIDNCHSFLKYNLQVAILIYER